MGINFSGTTFLARSLIALTFCSSGMLKTNAKILAVAWMSWTCKGSFKSNEITFGALFKPDQNGFLVYSTMWSSGNAWRSWAIWLWKTSQKIFTAISTHFEYDFDWLARYIFLIFSNFDLAIEGFCLFYLIIESMKCCLLS